MNAGATIIVIFLLLFCSVLGVGYFYSQINYRDAQLATQDEIIRQLQDQLSQSDAASQTCSEEKSALSQEIEQCSLDLQACQGQISTLQAQGQDCTAALAQETALKDKAIAEKLACEAQVSQLSTELEAAKAAHSTSSCQAAQTSTESPASPQANASSALTDLSAEDGEAPSSALVWALAVTGLALMAGLGWIGSHPRLSRPKRSQPVAMRANAFETVWVKMTREQAEQHARQKRRASKN